MSERLRKMMQSLNAAVNDDLDIVKQLVETFEGESHLYSRSFLQSMIDRTLNDKQDAVYWMKFVKRGSDIERRMKSKTAQLFRNQGAEVEKNMAGEDFRMALNSEDSKRILDAVMFDADEWDEKIGDNLKPFIEEAVRRGGDAETELVTDTGKSLKGRVVTKFDFDPHDQLVMAFLKEHPYKISALTDEYTEALLEMQIMEFLDKEESIAQLTRRVQRVFGFSERYRAQRIARTETAVAQNFGIHQGNVQTGVVWGEKWHTALDERTRDAHREATGQIKALEDPFVVGGEEMMQPGDDSLGASAGNIINCFPSKVNVSCKEIQAISRRWYDGLFYTIRTSTGNVLTATPNHPILTPDGWLPISSLVEGSNVICGAFGERKFLGNPNIDNNPTSIDKIFNSFSKISASCQRTIGIAMDFHGDGKTGDVDVVFSKGFLENTGDASFSQPVSQEDFSITNSRLRSLQSQSLFAEINNGLSSSSDGIIGSLSKTLPFSKSSLGHPNEHSITAIADFDSSLNESRSDSSSSEVEGFRKSLLGLACDISFDKIIAVDISSFSGHVYNLQSSNGWMFADDNITSYNDNSKNIITHNCRCTVSPILDKPEGFGE